MLFIDHVFKQGKEICDALLILSLLLGCLKCGKILFYHFQKLTWTPLFIWQVYCFSITANAKSIYSLVVK